MVEVVFLADGAKWIWDRFTEIAPPSATLIRDTVKHRAHRDFIQGEISYFTNNKNRMRYDVFRARRLPIGSGSIESACKTVIGGRMKQGGMSWSEAGANGMLQIRCSIASGRFLQDFLATLDHAA